jgi:hypothetical protein
MRNAFASIVQARPCPTFGRPVRLRGGPHRLRPGTSPQALRIPPRGGHPALRSLTRAGSRSPLAVSRFPLRARLELSIPVSHFGQRGITPAFGYDAPHPSAGGTPTLPINALPGAHYGPLRHPPRPGLPLTRFRLEITLPTARASRVPNDFLLHACRRHYPGEIPQANVAPLTWRTAAFPVSQTGRLPHCPFRGLLSVHSRSGLHARRVAKATLYRRLRRIRYLLRRSDCYRLERPVAGWESHPLRTADFHGALFAQCLLGRYPCPR